MTFVCKTACFWRDQLWAAGDTVSIDDKDAKPPQHFVQKADVPPVAPAADVEAEEDVGAGTNMREDLTALCLRNGIEVKPRMSLKSMRAALADKGIKVS